MSYQYVYVYIYCIIFAAENPHNMKYIDILAVPQNYVYEIMTVSKFFKFATYEPSNWFIFIYLIWV